MDLKKIGFHLPESIEFDEETLTDTYGKLIAEPLERGYGTTLGNALRRVLLSSIEGAAITAVKIPGAAHEFSTLKGVKEDVVDIILNIKKLRFKLYSNGTKIATIKASGPKSVTGHDVQDDAAFEVLNPDLLAAYDLIHQGESAERMADKWGLSREEQDDFAAESHRRASQAAKDQLTHALGTYR